MIYLLSAVVLAAWATALWRSHGCGAVARGLFLMSLAATGVRLLAGNVGVWADGMLDVGIALLITIVLPVWMCVYFPTWLAWRVLQPLGLRPAVLAAFWLSALVRRRDIPIRIFLGALRNVPFPCAGQVTADAWTALAAAVQAEASVLQELTALAAVAVGDLQPLGEGSSTDSLVDALVHSVQTQLYLKVDKSLAPLDADPAKRATHPLAAWEHWLALRQAVDRFEQRVGQDALKALWYSQIRDRVWGWAYAEWTERGEQSGWAMAIVFDWKADQAEMLGDLPAAAINRENARVARLAA